MPRKFGEIAFTPEVKAVQERQGSRQSYDRFVAQGEANDTIGDNIREFIDRMEGFYLGTIGSNGYPYIQFRGGNPGFLKILDPKTLGFADFRGNLQYISVGNLSANDKAFLFLMDYRHRRRLKIIGRARIVEGDLELLDRLSDPDDDAIVERAIIFEVEGWDWNCPQHIPLRYSAAEVENIAQPLRDRIAELEAEIAKLRDRSSQF